jgi:hypothetical protein
MAEILAVGTAFGVASSLLTFGDVAWRVVKRVKEYNEIVEEAPLVIKHIRAQLPILIEKMEEPKGSSDAGLVQVTPQSALAEAVASSVE